MTVAILYAEQWLLARLLGVVGIIFVGKSEGIVHRYAAAWFPPWPPSRVLAGWSCYTICYTTPRKQAENRPETCGSGDDQGTPNPFRRRRSLERSGSEIPDRESARAAEVDPFHPVSIRSTHALRTACITDYRHYSLLILTLSRTHIESGYHFPSNTGNTVTVERALPDRGSCPERICTF
jgi:hypothetical protein